MIQRHLQAVSAVMRQAQMAGMPRAKSEPCLNAQTGLRSAPGIFCKPSKVIFSQEVQITAAGANDFGITHRGRKRVNFILIHFDFLAFIKQRDLPTAYSESPTKSW